MQGDVMEPLAALAKTPSEVVATVVGLLAALANEPKLDRHVAAACTTAGVFSAIILAPVIIDVGQSIEITSEAFRHSPAQTAITGIMALTGVRIVGLIMRIIAEGETHAGRIIVAVGRRLFGVPTSGDADREDKPHDK